MLTDTLYSPSVSQLQRFDPKICIIITVIIRHPTIYNFMMSVVLNWQSCEILSWAHHCATDLVLLIGMSMSGRLSGCSALCFFSHSSTRERPVWYFPISIMTQTNTAERLHSFQSQVFSGNGPNARKIEVTATVMPRKSIHHGMEQGKGMYSNTT